MGREVFDREAAAVAAQLTDGPRLAIIGSTSFWHVQSQATCRALGRLLAELDDLVLLTGGVDGVGKVVGRNFFDSRPGRDGHRGVFHVLPHGYWRCDYGETLFAGSDMTERREVLGRVAQCYVVIEGGPGTAHEASVALGRSVCVIPVGRSGGYAGELYPQVSCPVFASESAWRDLARPDASPEQVADAISRIVRARVRGCLYRV